MSKKSCQYIRIGEQCSLLLWLYRATRIVEKINDDVQKRPDQTRVGFSRAKEARLMQVGKLFWLFRASFALVFKGTTGALKIGNQTREADGPLNRPPLFLGKLFQSRR